MKERPILFSAPMVRAILRDVGPKTQTRRVVKPQPVSESASGACWIEINGRHQWAWHEGEDQNILPNEKQFTCPYGQPGDRLWVRETWSPTNPISYGVMYRADYDHPSVGPWKPSIHMPRWASRITLEITGVRVERLQDISEADAVAEGIRISSQARRSDACYGIYECLMPDGKTHFNDSAYDLYRTLWEQINGPGTWAANPCVWVVEFKRLEGGAA